MRERGVRWTVGRAIAVTGRWIAGERQDVQRVPGHPFPAFPIYDEAIAWNQALNQQFLRERPPIRRAVWVLPDFAAVSNGGPNTLLRFAHHWADQGVETTIVVVDATIHRTSQALATEVRKGFGWHPKVRFVVGNVAGQLFDEACLPESDACVASLWTTAYYCLTYTRTRSKWYFIQDYEPLFYPAGVEYALAAATYEFGYLGIVNTPGLYEYVRQHHPDFQGIAFVPGVDTDVFHAEGRAPWPEDGPFRVFFYGRPGVPRNMFELGVTAMHQVFQRLGSRVEFLVAGWSDYPAGLPPTAQALGYLPYAETGALYRRCHAGMAFMATPHPSYLPLQLMACGAVPITTWNPATHWLLRPGVNSVECWPTPENLATAVEALATDASQWDTLRDGALEAARTLSWSAALDQVWTWVRGTPLGVAATQPPF